jgi:hypothetical protein
MGKMWCPNCCQQHKGDCKAPVVNDKMAKEISRKAGILNRGEQQKRDSAKKTFETHCRRLLSKSFTSRPSGSEIPPGFDTWKDGRGWYVFVAKREWWRDYGLSEEP